MSDIVMTKVKMHDGTFAYLLPNGTLVTVEAWDSIDAASRRMIVEADVNKNADPNDG